jgi:hypothetical protein
MRRSRHVKIGLRLRSALRLQSAQRRNRTSRIPRLKAAPRLNHTRAPRQADNRTVVVVAVASRTAVTKKGTNRH